MKKYKKVFFYHDVNARNDPKIKVLESILPMGYTWFFKTIEIMGEDSSSGYKMDLSKKITSTYFVSELKMNSEEEFMGFIDTCLELELFYRDEEGLIYSKRLVEHMTETDRIIKKKTEGVKNRWDKKKEADKINDMSDKGSSSARMEQRFNDDVTIAPRKNYPAQDRRPVKQPHEEIKKYKTDVGCDLDIWDSGNDRYFKKVFFQSDLLFMTVNGELKELQITIQNLLSKIGSGQGNEDDRKELDICEKRLKIIESPKFKPSQEHLHAEKLQRYHAVRILIETLGVSANVSDHNNYMDKEACKKLYEMCEDGFNAYTSLNHYQDIALAIKRKSNDFAFRVKNLYNQIIIKLGDAIDSDYTEKNNVVDKILEKHTGIF